MALFLIGNIFNGKLIINTIANSVYNQLLVSALLAVSLWVTLVYLNTESLWQRK